MLKYLACSGSTVKKRLRLKHILLGGIIIAATTPQLGSIATVHAGIDSYVINEGENWTLPESVQRSANTGDYEVYAPDLLYNYKKTGATTLPSHIDSIIGLHVNWRYLCPQSSDCDVMHGKFKETVTWLIQNQQRKIIIKLKANCIKSYTAEDTSGKRDSSGLWEPGYPAHGVSQTDSNCGYHLPHIPYWVVKNENNTMNTTKIYKHHKNADPKSTYAINGKIWNSEIKEAYKNFVDSLVNLPVPDHQGTGTIPLITHPKFAGIFIGGLSFDEGEEFFLGTGATDSLESQYGFSPDTLYSYIDRINAWRDAIDRAVTDNEDLFKCIGKVAHFWVSRIGHATQIQANTYKNKLAIMQDSIARKGFGTQYSVIEYTNLVYLADSRTDSLYFYPVITDNGYLRYKWNDMRNRFFKEEGELVLGRHNYKNAVFYYNSQSALGTDPRIDTSSYKISDYHSTAILLKSAQIGFTHLWTGEWVGNTINGNLVAAAGSAKMEYWRKIAGKGPGQAPEGMCWLRDAYTHLNPNVSIKNMERFLYQRDFNTVLLSDTSYNGHSTGDFFIVRPYLNGDKVYAPSGWNNDSCKCAPLETNGYCSREATARKIGLDSSMVFFVDDSLKQSQNFTLYITYYYSSAYQSNNLLNVNIRNTDSSFTKELKQENNTTTGWKTASFTITGNTFNNNQYTFNNNNWDILLQSKVSGLPIRFVRLVKN